MAIAFRQKSFSTATAAGVTGTEPAGTVQNDVMVAMLVADAGITSFGAPAGWTTQQAITVSATDATFRYWLGYIVRGASAPSLAWTWTGSFYYELHILGYSGCSASPVEAYTNGGNSHVTNHNAQPAAFDPPSVTTLGASRMVVCGGVDWVGNLGGWTAPTGYTLRSDNTNGNDGGMGDKTVAIAGAEDPGRWTNGGTSPAASDLWQWTLALAPPSSAAKGGEVEITRQAQVRGSFW